MTRVDELCQWYWGTHGCTLPAGDHTIHRCQNGHRGEPCSEYDSENRTARYWDGEGEWCEWMPHNYAWHGNGATDD